MTLNNGVPIMKRVWVKVIFESRSDKNENGHSKHIVYCDKLTFMYVLKRKLVSITYRRHWFWGIYLNIANPISSFRHHFVEFSSGNRSSIWLNIFKPKKRSALLIPLATGHCKNWFFVCFQVNDFLVFWIWLKF